MGYSLFGLFVIWHGLRLLGHAIKKIKKLNLVGFATANFRIQYHHDDH
jgi:hypothetical protein